MERLVLLASRIGSYVVDRLLFLLLMYVLGRFGVLGYAVDLAALFLYRWLMTAILGYTVGMLLFRLRLDKYSWRTCLTREIARFASAFYLIGYAYAFLDKRCRTMHDLVSETCVGFSRSRVKAAAGSTSSVADRADDDGFNRSGRLDSFLKPIAVLLLFISVCRWTTGFVLDDIGGIGLKRVAVSREYVQNFDGDNLASLSQNELYLQTMGRRYTAIAGVDHKLILVRLANKHDHSEFYRMVARDTELGGKLLFKVPMSIQFLGSGVFRQRRELCGVSAGAGRKVVLIDSGGRFFANALSRLRNIVMVKCGDVDMDGRDEVVLLGRSGDMEVLKYTGGVLKSIFFGKPGDDVQITAFYARNGLNVAVVDTDGAMQRYRFADGGFRMISEAEIDKAVVASGQVEAFEAGRQMLISNVSRSNMMFMAGKLQRLSLYGSGNGDKHRLIMIADFGRRPSRAYSFHVHSLEEVADIDGDGVEELILKAVDKSDVTGGKYRLEIYRIDNAMMKWNRLLVRIRTALGG